MGLIQFDTQRAFLIPDDKREEYFQLVDVVASHCPVAMNLCNIKQSWNTDHDPIIVIDSEHFSEKNWNAILSNLKKMDAREVTETFIES